ncbi:MAG: hypothetical protein KKD44_13950 [Proteobacteria bacterium]|nr:hypothetical protein [Pseudomonadota bacterium]
MRTLGILPAMTIGTASFRKRYILKLLANPVCLMPLLAGLTDLMVLWTFSIGSGALIFAGIAGILGGLGMFLTRLALGDKDAAEHVLEAIQKTALKHREKTLDALDKRLCLDDDPRPEQCLRDLRGLARVFEQGRSWTGSLKASSTVDILSGVDRLFRECVLLLEKTIELQTAAEKVSDDAMRKPLIKHREKIISDIDQSIRHLGKILSGIKTLDGSKENARNTDLARIREELDQSLNVALKVHERMGSLDQEIGILTKE